MVFYTLRVDFVMFGKVRLNYDFSLLHENTRFFINGSSSTEGLLCLQVR